MQWRTTIVGTYRLTGIAAKYPAVERNGLRSLPLALDCSARDTASGIYGAIIQNCTIRTHTYTCPATAAATLCNGRIVGVDFGIDKEFTEVQH